MCYDVAHAAHFTKVEFKDGPAGCLGQVRRGLPDDFDAPYHGVLFFFGGVKISLSGVFDVGTDEPGGFQDVAQSADLISFHISTRQWPECARVRSDWVISPGSDARQNPQGGRSIPPPRPPFPIIRRSRPKLIRQALPAGLHHYRARLGHSPRNRTLPGAECD